MSCEMMAPERLPGPGSPESSGRMGAGGLRGCWRVGRVEHRGSEMQSRATSQGLAKDRGSLEPVCRPRGADRSMGKPEGPWVLIMEGPVSSQVLTCFEPLLSQLSDGNDALSCPHGALTRFE